MWTCPKCSAKVDPSFEVCWQCGTSPDGDEDPDFVRAEDVPPIEDPRYDPIAEPDAAAPGGTSQAALVECYQAMDLMEAKFLADQLTAQGIAALADTQDFQDALGTWDGNPRVYCRAGDLPRARAWLAEFDRRQGEHGRS
jgi:hypothetical protein